MADLVVTSVWWIVGILLISGAAFLVGELIGKIIGSIDAANLPTIRSVKQCRSEKDEHEEFAE